MAISCALYRYDKECHQQYTEIYLDRLFCRSRVWGSHTNIESVCQLILSALSASWTAVVSHCPTRVQHRRVRRKPKTSSFLAGGIRFLGLRRRYSLPTQILLRSGKQSGESINIPTHVYRYDFVGWLWSHNPLIISQKLHSPAWAQVWRALLSIKAFLKTSGLPCCEVCTTSPI